MDSRAKGNRLRLGRRSEPGRAYLITSVTRDRAPVFSDMKAARGLVQVLREQSEQGRVQSLAFVVMPDHLHWLVQLKDEDLSRVVARVKTLSATRVAALKWQRGFHDRAIRREEDLRTAARYIIANPLRAGLVESVGDYPHWDAIWL